MLQLLEPRRPHAEDDAPGETTALTYGKSGGCPLSWRLPQRQPHILGANHEVEEKAGHNHCS